MKIVLVHPFINDRGGAAYVVGKIAEYFDAKIYCVEYIQAKTFEMFKNIEIEQLPTLELTKVLPKRLSMGISSGFTFFFSKIKDYDIINAHGTPAEWIRNRNSPVVWYCHTPNREAFDLYHWRMAKRAPYERIPYWLAIQAFKAIEYSIVPKIEYVIANSKNTQERLIKYLGKKSEVVYPVFEKSRFECLDYKKYFFYPSRIVPEKRFEYAIRAFKKFKQRISCKGWKFVIAGFLSERPEHQAYYHYLRSLVDEDIKILINVSEQKMRELYGNAYCILFTPIDEDFGMVPLEGFMAQKPCIAVKEGGPKEIITNGKNGFLISSIDEMAEKMQYLVENPNINEKMGREGWKKIGKEFSERKFFSKLRKIFRQILMQKIRC